MVNPGEPSEFSELSQVSLPERSMVNPGEPSECSELSQVSLPGVAPGVLNAESW